MSGPAEWGMAGTGSKRRNTRQYGPASWGLARQAQASQLNEYTKAKQEQEKFVKQKEKVAKDYTDHFFKQADSSQVVFGIMDSLGKRAERGDLDSAFKYDALLKDERLKQYTKPKPAVFNVNPATGTDPFSQKSREQIKNPLNPTKVAVPKPDRPAVAPPQGGYGQVPQSFEEVYSPGPRLSPGQTGATMAVGLAQGLAQPYIRATYRGPSRAIRQVAGVEADNQNKTSGLLETIGKNITMYRQILESETASPAQKKRAQEELNLSMLEIKKLVEDETANVQDVQNFTSNKKNLAAGGEILLDALGAKLASSVIKGGYTGMNKVALSTGSGSMIGAGVGVTSGIQNDSDNMTRDALVGGGFGASLGLLASGAPMLARAGANTKTGQAVTKGGKRLMEIPRGPLNRLETAIAPTIRNLTEPAKKKFFATEIGQKFQKASDRFGSLISEDNIIKKRFRGKVDREGIDIPTKLEHLKTDIVAAGSEGQNLALTNKHFIKVYSLIQNEGKGFLKGKSRKQAWNDLGKFITDKQTVINDNKLINAGVVKGKIKKVPVGNKLQEEIYSELNKAYKAQLTLRYKNGAITKVDYEKYLKDGDYIRIQRELTAEELALGSQAKGTGKSNTAKQKLQGSDKKAVDPFATYIKDYMDAASFAKLNEYKRYIVEVGQQHKTLVHETLKSANKIMTRRELMSELKQSSHYKKQLLKLEKSQAKYIRKIQIEYNRLNRKGLNAALKKEGLEPLPDFVPEGMGGKVPTSKTGKSTTDFVQGTRGTVREPSKRIARLSKKRDELIKQAEALDPSRKSKGKTDKGLLAISADPRKAKQLRAEADKIQKEINNIQRKVQPKAVDANTAPSKISEAETRKFLNNLVEAEDGQYKLIKKMILARDDKLKVAFNEIENIRSSIDTATEINKNLIKEIRKNADESTTGKTTISTWKNGIQEFRRIDEDAYTQLQRYGKGLEGWYVDVAMGFSRMLRTGATAANPAFATVNYFRDLVTSFINSDDVFATHNPFALGRGIKEAVVKPVGKMTVGRWLSPDSKISQMLEPSDLYKMWMKDNSNILYIDLARKIKEASAESQRLSGVNKGRNYPKRAFRGVEGAISASEKATRFMNWSGKYKKAIASGVDESRAVELANIASRGNSINFANQSELGKFAKIFNPYINANVQGARQLAISLRDRPISTTFKISATVIAPVMATTYHNLSDPNKQEMYARLMSEKPWVLENNIVYITDGGQIFTLPLPPGINKMAQPFRNYVEAQFIGDRQSFTETTKNIFLDPFNPVGSSSNEILGNTVLSGTKPVVELRLNKDIYTGRSIIPDDMIGLNPEDQVFETTPQLYRDIGKILNISPLKIRHAVKGYTAGAGEGLLGTVDQMRGAETGGRAFDEQIKGRFFQQNAPEGLWGTFYGGGKGNKGLDAVQNIKKHASKQINEYLKANYDSEEANVKAREINAMIDNEIKQLNEGYGKFERGESKQQQIKWLNELKIPMENNNISTRSKNSRIKER